MERVMRNKHILVIAMILFAILIFVMPCSSSYASETSAQNNASVLETPSTEATMSTNVSNIASNTLSEASTSTVRERSAVLANLAPVRDASAWEKLVQAANAAENIAIPVDSNISVGNSTQELRVKSGSVLTLTGTGTIVGDEKGHVIVEKGGKLILNGPSFKDTQFIVNGEMEFNAGSITDTVINGPIIFVQNGKLTINKGAEFSRNKIDVSAPKVFPENLKDSRYAPITLYNSDLIIKGGNFTNNKGLQFGGVVASWSKNLKNIIEISDGNFEKNLADHPKKYALGGAIFADGVFMKMSGGSVINNVAEFGGGITVLNGSLKLSGGKIYSNSNGDFKGKGGGLHLDSSDFTMTGGEIALNTANGFGGGAYIINSKSTFDGGLFKENTALKSGGGLALLGQSETEITGLQVLDNISKGFWGGGGIYNDNKSTLRMKNALIKDNGIKDAFLVGAGNRPVSMQGGGIWNCPTGSTVMHITNGVAIFDNSAPNAGQEKQLKGAGDDFASIQKHVYDKEIEGEKGGQPVVITDRMLGGGARLWYQDGSIYNIHLNMPQEKQLPRYSQNNENKLIPYNIPITVHKAFKSVPDSNSKELASKLAMVIIEKNYATRTGISGGGIANNGKLIFGESETWKVKIKKTWEGDKPEDRPESLKVDVLVGGYKVDQVTLTKNNSWEAELSNFPNPKTLKDNKTGKLLPIECREHDSKGYNLKSEVSFDDNGKIINISLVNSKFIEIPVQKLWNDNNNAANLRPKSIVVELLNHGVATGDKVILSEDNNWKAKFEKLPIYRDKKEALYSVREVKANSYYAQVTGDAKKGFTITNSLTPPPPYTPPEEPPYEPPHNPPFEPPYTPPVEEVKKISYIPKTSDVNLQGYGLGFVLLGMSTLVSAAVLKRKALN